MFDTNNKYIIFKMVITSNTLTRNSTYTRCMPSVLPIYANKTMPKKNRKNGINIMERTVKNTVFKTDMEDMMSVW